MEATANTQAASSTASCRRKAVIFFFIPFPLYARSRRVTSTLSPG